MSSPDKRRKIGVCIGAVLASIGLCRATLAQCAEHDYDWAVLFGNWSLPENWQHPEWDPDAEECTPRSGLPGADDHVILRNSGTAILTGSTHVGAIDTYQSSRFIVQGGSLTAVSIAVDDGQMDLQLGSVQAEWQQIGVQPHGEVSGWLVQDGGFNEAQVYMIVGNLPGSLGRYELNAGTLSSKDVLIGNEGRGTMVHTGGTCTVDGAGLAVGTRAGGTGTYDLSGAAVLVTAALGVGAAGAGTFTQNGGTNEVTGGLNVGGEPTGVGEYTLVIGELTSGHANIGLHGTGTFEQFDGEFIVAGVLGVGNGDTSSGTYQLRGGVLSAEAMQVGHSGSGTFVQTGGVANLGGFNLGVDAGATGLYELQAGDLDTTSLGNNIGWSGHGTLRQSGGTLAMSGHLVLGREVGSEGEYSLSDGTLSCDNLSVGFRGSGNLVQSGGSVSVSSTFAIGAEAGSSGTCELNAGALTVDYVVRVGGEGNGSLLLNEATATLDTAILEIGMGAGAGLMNIAGAGSGITVEDLDFGANAEVLAVPGSRIKVTGSRIQNYSIDEAALAGLEELNVICDGDEVYLEVAGLHGPNPDACSNNFVIDTLTINGTAILQDQIDNGNHEGAYGSDEALYVNHLDGDGMLVTNGLPCYEGCSPCHFNGGRICPCLVRADFDRDCDVDQDDLDVFEACATGPAILYSPAALPEPPPGCTLTPDNKGHIAADFNEDGDVDQADFAIFQSCYSGPGNPPHCSCAD